MKSSRSKGFSVYLITNTVNGKKYVGKTCADLPTRWQEHRRAAFRNDTSNRPLFNAIRKYGSAAFTIELLQSADNEQEVNDMEVLWIAKLGCQVPGGYNVEAGGNGSSGYKWGPRRAKTTFAEFSRIPFAVLSDKGIKPIHVMVYAILSAYERNGGMVRTGQRLLSESTGLSRRYFRTVLDRLVRSGHVAVIVVGKGQRQAYRLTDPMFVRWEATKRNRGSEGLFCGCCQKPMRGVVCEDCRQYRYDVADAI